MVNLNICNSNRINFNIHNDSVTSNQKAGVALATGCIGKLQKKLGRTISVTFNNKTFEVNKKSFDKWVARNAPEIASDNSTASEKINKIYMKKLEVDSVLFNANNKKRLAKAATTIQAAFRGYKARKAVSKILYEADAAFRRKKANQKFEFDRRLFWDRVDEEVQYNIESVLLSYHMKKPTRILIDPETIRSLKPPIDMLIDTLTNVGNWFLTHPFGSQK